MFERLATGEPTWGIEPTDRIEVEASVEVEGTSREPVELGEWRFRVFLSEPTVRITMLEPLESEMLLPFGEQLLIVGSKVDNIPPAILVIRCHRPADGAGPR